MRIRSGEGGIRTRERACAPYSLSRRVPSATRPPLRETCGLYASKRSPLDGGRPGDRGPHLASFCPLYPGVHARQMEVPPTPDAPEQPMPDPSGPPVPGPEPSRAPDPGTPRVPEPSPPEQPVPDSPDVPEPDPKGPETPAEPPERPEPQIPPGQSR